MLRIHIGHHFYGAGNAGDDLMLAGFLEAMDAFFESRFLETRRPSSAQGHLDRAAITCCTPFDRVALERRFPEINWLPYDNSQRSLAVEECDVWLGLGGSPWQNAVSRWFVNHLEEERVLCEKAKRPMYFLGVGGQDKAAFLLPETRKLCSQVAAIWTRDPRSADALSSAGGAHAVREGADLAHIFLKKHLSGSPKAGSMVAVLNFEYQRWEGLRSAMEQTRLLGAREKVWLAQEIRSLPGAELDSYSTLQPEMQREWKLVKLGEEPPLKTLTHWPVGQWTLSSRFHSSLVAAWGGSKIVTLGINEKLRSVAHAYRIPCMELGDDPRSLTTLLSASLPVERRLLEREALKAQEACLEFFSLVTRRR